MDIIDFRRDIDFIDDGTFPEYTVEVLINGKTINELIVDIERPFAEAYDDPEAAGSYNNLPIDRFLDELERYTDNEDDLHAAICGGWWGEWELLIRITTDKNSVVWSDFSNSQREWQYDKFGPFVFDKIQYHEALQKVKSWLEEEKAAYAALPIYKSWYESQNKTAKLLPLHEKYSKSPVLLVEYWGEQTPIIGYEKEYSPLMFREARVDEMLKDGVKLENNIHPIGFVVYYTEPDDIPYSTSSMDDISMEDLKTPYGYNWSEEDEKYSQDMLHCRIDAYCTVMFRVNNDNQICGIILVRDTNILKMEIDNSVALKFNNEKEAIDTLKYYFRNSNFTGGYDSFSDAIIYRNLCNNKRLRGKDLVIDYLQSETDNSYWYKGKIKKSYSNGKDSAEAGRYVLIHSDDGNRTEIHEIVTAEIDELGKIKTLTVQYCYDYDIYIDIGQTRETENIWPIKYFSDAIRQGNMLLFFNCLSSKASSFDGLKKDFSSSYEIVYHWEQLYKRIKADGAEMFGIPVRVTGFIDNSKKDDHRIGDIGAAVKLVGATEYEFIMFFSFDEEGNVIRLDKDRSQNYKLEEIRYKYKPGYYCH